VGTIWFDGKCLSFEPESHPDGIYGRFVVEGGRVTAFLPEEVPAYTPPPCVQHPSPCGDSGTGSGGGSGGGAAAPPAVSPSGDNLTRLDALGRLMSELFATGSGAAVVSGKGTASSPLRIHVAQQAADTAVQTDTPDILRVNGRIVGHRTPSGAGPVINGVEYDQYGHAVRAAAGAGGLSGVASVDTEESAIRKSGTAGAVVLTLPTFFSTTQTVHTGRQAVDIDMYGRVIAYRTELLDDLDRVSVPVPGGWDTFGFVFGLYLPGLLRVSLQADLGFTDTGAWGLAAKAGARVLLDDTPLQTFVRYDGGHGVGLEALTAQEIAAGQHQITLSLPAANPEGAWGLLDISRCRL
jgi:hypothetical protein